jgi:serine/threonine protein kinase
MNEDFDETMKSRVRTTPEAQNTFVPGQVVGGKFKVISRLGSGGMGTVYRVEQIFLQKEFALKTMDKHTGSDVMVQRFQLEAKAAFSLNHPNLVKVHDYGILDHGNPYLVMDYINGITFAEYLKEHGPLPIEYIAPLFAQACFGLMAAHEQSVVHRDIKPANLMLLSNVALDTEGSVKLVDFGIAKLVNREDGEIQALTRTGEIFGSPLYMSPEQCSSGTVDHRSDIYSLGCVLFEMLTGTPPHMGQNALKTLLLHQAAETPTLKEASLGQDFPEPLERIVAKMLRKYPEQRYQNIGQVAHDLTVFGSENRAMPKLKPPRTLQKPKVTTEAKVVSMTSTKLYTLLAITGLLAAVSAGSAVYLIKNERAKSVTRDQIALKTEAKDAPRTSEATEQNAAEPEDENLAQSNMIKASGVLAGLDPIEEGEVIKDGQRQHRYFFPIIKIGELCHYNFPSIGAPYHDAQGIVDVPADMPLGIKLGGPYMVAMLKSPSIFRKIPGKDFQGLIFETPTDPTSEALIDEIPPELIVRNTAVALNNLSGWKNLATIHIKNCALHEDALRAFNNFSKLKRWEIEHCELDLESIVKQPFLLKVAELELTNSKFDFAPIIKRISASPNLQLIAVDHPLSIDDLRALKKCPRLTTLILVTGKIDDEKVAEICKLKQLQIVRLYNMTLSTKQIKMLTHCSWLKAIVVSASMYGGPVAIENIKAIDPRITFAGEVQFAR